MKAKAQEPKQKIISDLTEKRRAILETVALLSPEAQDQVFLSEWSVMDILAHLVGWDFTNIATVQAIMAGQLPDFYAHHDRGWRTYNARLVKEYKHEDSTKMLETLRESHQQLINFLESLPEEAFDKDYGVRYGRYKVTISRLLRTEASDEEEHHRQIQVFLDTVDDSMKEGYNR